MDILTRLYADAKQWPHRITSLAVGTMVGSLGLISCDRPPGNTPTQGGTDRPDVVATSTIIADLTERIGGDAIDLTGILDPGADPHVYEPVPQDTIAFEEADLILYNGYNLEPGLIRIMNAAGINAETLAVGEVVPPLTLEYEGQTEPDPHVWGDVENAIAMTEAIRDALVAIAPDDAADITQNAEQLTAELTRLDGWIADQVATIPADQRQLVTTHDAFEYYAQAYGLEVAGTLIGISTEEQPSAQTVQQLVESVRSLGVPTIFAETTINPRLINTVAEEAGVTLAPQELFSDSIGTPGGVGDSYINMMVANTEAVVSGLGGEVVPFTANPAAAQ
ncbi:MAG: zinc ABC transporter substrate-binding protein [Synechococcales bacterium]|nr:zinc ABC transporter substrate-binding protein [Synechococcales bacterium]